MVRGSEKGYVHSMDYVGPYSPDVDGNICGCAGINVDDLLLKTVAFFLAESNGHGLKTRLRQQNKQLVFLHKVNIYTWSATYVAVQV